MAHEYAVNVGISFALVLAFRTVILISWLALAWLLVGGIVAVGGTFEIKVPRFLAASTCSARVCLPVFAAAFAASAERLWHVLQMFCKTLHNELQRAVGDKLQATCCSARNSAGCSELGGPFGVVLFWID